MFRSQTYGGLEFNEIPAKLKDWYEKNKKYESDFSIVIGTDSQNFSDTKMVSVITMICEGHGGIFFYEVSRQDLIKDVRTKLHVETNASLTLADNLIKMLEEKEFEELFLNCHFSIHVDAGHSTYGKTKDLIPELIGWIKACGYECQVKPDSYAASSIADKISK